jgi:hypothetical protein
MPRNRNRNRRNHSDEEGGRQLLAPGRGIAPGFLLNPPLSYPRQAFATMWVPALTVVIPITTGTVAQTVVLDPTARVNNWPTRFASLFEEYRVIGIEMKVRASQGVVTGGVNGTHVSWWDEYSSGTPTATQAIQRVTKERSNNADNRLSQYNLKWKPQDPKDYEFFATATGTQPVFFKIYTDVANFANSNISSSNEFVLQPWFMVQFRGLRG